MIYSINCHIIPSILKYTDIVSVPQKDKINVMNDLCPVALTSEDMKCLEKVILRRMKSYFSPLQDSLQFAYHEG